MVCGQLLGQSRQSPVSLSCREREAPAVTFTPIIVSAVHVSRTFGESEAAEHALTDVIVRADVLQALTHA